MSDELEDLLAAVDAVEDAAKKVMKYSRVASLLYKLADALFISAASVAIAYVLFPHWQLITAWLVALVAAFTADRLGDHYYHKAFREVDALDQLAIELTKKIDNKR